VSKFADGCSELLLDVVEFEVHVCGPPICVPIRG
jgi:hypothetical protein